MNTTMVNELPPFERPTMTWAEAEVWLPNGLTYRRVDYWERQGSIDIAKEGVGSGSRRFFSRQDVWRLRVIGRLIGLAAMPTMMSGTLVRLIWDALAGQHAAFRAAGATHLYISGDAVAGWRVATDLAPEATAAVVVRLD